MANNGLLNWKGLDTNGQNSQMLENCQAEEQPQKSSLTDLQNPSEAEIPQSDVFSSHMLHGVSQHANALALAIRRNTEELSKMEKIYQSLEEQRKREKQEHDKVLAECHRLMGELCAVKAECREYKQNVRFLKREIAKTLWEKHSSKIQRALKQEELDRCKTTLVEYESKMDATRNKAAEMEAETDVEVELRHLKHQVEDLKTQKAELERKERNMMTECGMVMTETYLHEDIRNLQKQIEEKKAIQETKKREVEQCEQKCHKLDTANQILLKKKSAILTRLNRKVEDQRESYNTWKSREDFLKQQIELIKEKLQKFAE